MREVHSCNGCSSPPPSHDVLKLDVLSDPSPLLSPVLVSLCSLPSPLHLEATLVPSQRPHRQHRTPSHLWAFQPSLPLYYSQSPLEGRTERGHHQTASPAPPRWLFVRAG